MDLNIQNSSDSLALQLTQPFPATKSWQLFFFYINTFIIWHIKSLSQPVLNMEMSFLWKIYEQMKTLFAHQL